MEIVTIGAADGLVGPRRAGPGEGPKHANVHAECLNCGATLHGRYCQDCGQSDDDHHRSIFHLIWEAIEGLTHLDGRLMRTIPPLFLKPGQLARDHFEGRRQRHVPPFRLFLITLLIFMFVLEMRTHGGKPPAPAPAHPPAAAAITDKAQDAAEADKPGREMRAAIRAAVGKAPKPDGANLDIGAGDAPEARPGAPVRAAPGVTIRSDTNATGESATEQGLNQMEASDFSKSLGGRWLLEHGRKANANRELFRATMFEWGHRLAILMLPIFAGMLTLCYFYKRQFYIYDHLVVAMHFLSFVFLIWAIAYALPDPVGGFLMLAATIWTPVNLFMTLRGAYGSSIIGAGVKSLALWIATLSLFLALLLGVIFVAMGTL